MTDRSRRCPVAVRHAAGTTSPVARAHPGALFLLVGGLWLLAVLLHSGPAHAQGPEAQSRFTGSVSALRERWLPELTAQLAALRAESGAGIEAAGAAGTVADMEAGLETMDAALLETAQALAAQRLVLADVTGPAERFTRAAVAFGGATEVLVGKDPRLEPLRLEDAAARRRLLALAEAYRGFSAEVSRLLDALPDAIEARHRQLNPNP
ncbi:MAG TPA: hypothetical protein ENN42_00420 [Thioalkalivibrio sp.]|nr:hypothetical protein [Thioalkalivibrio sp.]